MARGSCFVLQQPGAFGVHIRIERWGVAVEQAGGKAAANGGEGWFSG